MWRISHCKVATSSNDLALQEINARPEHAHGCVFVVDQQTKGRGRQGKFWHSEPGDGLYLSLVIKPSLSSKYWPLLSFVTSLCMYRAICDCFEGLSQVLALKWPNDIVTDTHKLAGILLEAHHDFVVIGCGVNLKNAPKLEKSGFAPGDLSLYHPGAEQHKDKLLGRFLHHFEAALSRFEHAEFASLIHAWKKHCSLLGKQISVHYGDNQVSGLARDIDASGSLILIDEFGVSHKITSGDVHLMGRTDDTHH